MNGLCVHGKPLSRPELCERCWELAWALGLVDTKEPPENAADVPAATVRLPRGVVQKR